jgi:hypothetical protein
VANELWIAREILSKPGARTDLGKNLPRFTWSGYCVEIGIDYHTANRWLNQWFPESLTLENKPYAKSYAIRAEIRLGELLKATERAEGKRTDLVSSGNQVDKPTLADLFIQVE